MSVSSQGYNEDFYAWALSTAEMIRKGRFSEIDVEHVAEEIESMGRSDKRALIHRLAVLIAHLLKWQFQPVRQSNSWKYTIKEQRFRVKQLLEESPSLKYEIEMKAFKTAYQEALILAAKQTGIAEDNFPKDCPFSLQQCLDDEFFPE